MNKLLTFVLGLVLWSACSAPNKVVQQTSSSQKIEGNLIPQDNSITADASMESFIAPFRESLEEEMSRSITHIARNLESSKGESTLGNFVTDAFFNYVKTEVDSTIDFALLNLGGMRSDAVAQGDFTRGELITLLPFDNRLVIVEMKGKQLENMFDFIVRRHGEPFANMTMVVSSDSYEVEIDGKPFDHNKVYRVATIDYLQRGGGGMAFFKDVEHVEATDILLREAVKQYCLTKESIDVELDGRYKELN
ncbi:5'-nucleotidase C-terminal domain-containing protein [Sediminitomix flava]|nr:5'-nucleotidase [Sediminitomix flava]